MTVNSLKEKLARFMYGRYGLDQLYYALFVAYIVLILLNVVLVSVLLGLLSWAVVFFMFYRMFSRNIEKRRAENEKYLFLQKKSKQVILRTVNRVKEFKTHRYRTCPHCKAVLRLPRKVGDHTVTCPQCKQGFDVHIKW